MTSTTTDQLTADPNPGPGWARDGEEWRWTGDPFSDPPVPEGFYVSDPFSDRIRRVDPPARELDRFSSDEGLSTSTTAEPPAARPTPGCRAPGRPAPAREPSNTVSAKRAAATEAPAKAARSVPKPRTLYREPVDQAEHRRAVRDILRGGGITRAVALEAHDQIGMTYAEKGQRVPFGQIRRELTQTYLAPFVGWSPRKVNGAMAEAVEAALFRRVDNGQGGKGNTNGATYVAIVPDHWS